MLTALYGERLVNCQRYGLGERSIDTSPTGVRNASSLAGEVSASALVVFTAAWHARAWPDGGSGTGSDSSCSATSPVGRVRPLSA